MADLITKAYDGFLHDDASAYSSQNINGTVIHGFYRVYVRPVTNSCYFDTSAGASPSALVPDPDPVVDDWRLLGLIDKDDGIDLSFDHENLEVYAGGFHGKVAEKVINVTGTCTVPLIQAGFHMLAQNNTLAWGHGLDDVEADEEPVDGSYITEVAKSTTDGSEQRAYIRQGLGSPGCKTSVQLRIDIPQRICGSDSALSLTADGRSTELGDEIYEQFDYLTQNWIFYNATIQMNHSHAFKDGEIIKVPLEYKLDPVGREKLVEVSGGGNRHPVMSANGFWLGEVFIETDWTNTAA